MPNLSIIVPFAGSTADLIPDLRAACEGAELIIVDNASDEATAGALVALAPAVYIRNDTNLGFAAGNNQGYARATGDVIMFLNSDVAAAPGWLRAVVADVRDGALYGPALQAQLVAGRHLPYIEGWCVAATRATWEQLRPRLEDWTAAKARGEWNHIQQHLAETGKRPLMQSGPWNAEAYPGPYWEDNALCYEALLLGIDLVQTAWQVQHKGGRTAGPIMRHGASFARNERAFTDRVLATMQPLDMTPTWQRYMQAVYTQSDIQHHLGLLYSLARGNVLELGTRSGVSTAALLAGVEARGGHVWSVDLDPRSAEVAKGHLQWTFVQGDSRDTLIVERILQHVGDLSSTREYIDDDPRIDLLLIDTEHVVDVTAAELALWSPHMRPGGRILLHDPETFPGVRRAITEFCARTGWAVTYVLPCNGMAVIEVPK